jgi:uncharacterized lipoprotein
MFGRTSMTWVLAISVFWLSACGRVNEPEKSVQPEKNAESPAGAQQITLHVPGMINRQGIT